MQPIVAPAIGSENDGRIPMPITVVVGTMLSHRLDASIWTVAR
jgi:hypothetical protein